MIENKPQDPYYYEDVIDLRELVQTLLNYKWIITAATLLAALVAFLVSSFLLSQRYQASAYVTLIEPIVQVNLNTGIRISPVIPDTKALAELAGSDSIRRDLKVMLGLSEDEPIEMEVASQGRTQLRLQITAGDPELVALIANAWAEIVLKDMLGTWEHSRQVLENEVQKTKEAWVNAQSSLEAYLSQSQAEVLTVKLSTAKNNLQIKLNKIGHNQLLISDALAFLAQIGDFNAGDPLSTGNVLSIIALQQRASGAISGTQFQFQGEELLGLGFTAAVGREIILNLISALEGQNVEIEAELPDLEISISTLSVVLESEKSKGEIFSQERDLYRTAYIEFATQLEKTKVTQMQEGKSALISARAVVPREKSGPNTTLYTAMAGMVGLMIAVGSVFVYEWWNKEEEPV